MEANNNTRNLVQQVGSGEFNVMELATAYADYNRKKQIVEDSKKDSGFFGGSKASAAQEACLKAHQKYLDLVHEYTTVMKLKVKTNPSAPKPAATESAVTEDREVIMAVQQGP